MSSMSSVGGISESPDVQQDIGRLLQDANALAVSLSIPRFKVVLCMLQLAEMRASLKLNAGDEILVLVRKEVIPSLKAIKDITPYLTTERQPEQERGQHRDQDHPAAAALRRGFDQAGRGVGQKARQNRPPGPYRSAWKNNVPSASMNRSIRL